MELEEGLKLNFAAITWVFIHMNSELRTPGSLKATPRIVGSFTAGENERDFALKMRFIPNFQVKFIRLRLVFTEKNPHNNDVLFKRCRFRVRVP